MRARVLWSLRTVAETVLMRLSTNRIRAHAFAEVDDAYYDVLDIVPNTLIRSADRRARYIGARRCVRMNWRNSSFGWQAIRVSTWSRQPRSWQPSRCHPSLMRARFVAPSSNGWRRISGRRWKTDCNRFAVGSMLMHSRSAHRPIQG